MNACSKLLLLAASAAMSACALMPLPGEPAAHRVVVDGETFTLRQITESTWTASAASGLKALAATPASTAALQRAVERVSGCAVTDSDYARQGRQFDAQVDCGSGLSR
jgi:hypothetical protein